MPRIAVIGYGNPLRGDDGLGWLAVEQLRAVLHTPEVALVACHQLTPELAELVSRVQRAVFIDASACGAAGIWRCEHIAAASDVPATFTHHLEPATLLGLALALYGACPTEAVVMTVAGASFEVGTEVSPTVAAVLPRLVEHVCEYVGVGGQGSGVGRKQPSNYY